MIATLGEGLLEVGVGASVDAESLGLGFGGDAANVAVMASRMGAPTRLITRVGDDAVGRLLLGYWREQGIDVDAVVVDTAASTGLYTNETDEGGNHSFGYYRHRSAASLLGGADLERGLAAPVRMLHTTGITLSISATAAEAVRIAIAHARANGLTVAFDFNFRPPLEPDPEAILAAAKQADIVLLSRDEAEGILGSSVPEDILAALGDTPREVLVTNGPRDAMLLQAGRSYRLRPPQVGVVNAAGAGDAFAGAYLASRLRGDRPAEALGAAVAAASLSCTQAGCARGYPDEREVRQLAAELSRQVDDEAGTSARFGS